MDSDYPAWVQEMRVNPTRFAVEAYLDRNPEARDIEPLEVLALVGLAILTAHNGPETDDMLSDLGWHDADIRWIEARKVFYKMLVTIRRAHQAAELPS